jgi:hypothetical protein
MCPDGWQLTDFGVLFASPRGTRDTLRIGECGSAACFAAVVYLLATVQPASTSLALLLEVHVVDIYGAPARILALARHPAEATDYVTQVPAGERDLVPFPGIA